ncbi:MAG: hypothetical protein HRT88_12625 [Lentisphaeraceae bacterium]|nr:hypothetical protein [Lentisphaeraceae bacterium]
MITSPKPAKALFFVLSGEFWDFLKKWFPETPFQKLRGWIAFAGEFIFWTFQEKVFL